MKTCAVPKGKKLDIGFENDFLFSIADTYGIHKSSTMLHWHDSIEVCYLKQGTGIYLIGGREYPFSKGDIFLINSREVHVAYNDSNVIMQVLLFDPALLRSVDCSLEMESLMPFWQAGNAYSHKLNRTNEYYGQIVDILAEMERECNSKRSGYRAMIKSLLFKLSAVLARYLDIRQDGGIPAKLRNYYRLRCVFDYIDSNYDRVINLRELARQANMSVSNFCLVFKDSVGMTPMEYVNRARIVKASEMLAESDMKVNDVALSCGFESISNFIRNFKRYTGKVPREFRKIGR